MDSAFDLLKSADPDIVILFGFQVGQGCFARGSFGDRDNVGIPEVLFCTVFDLVPVDTLSFCPTDCQLTFCGFQRFDLRRFQIDIAGDGSDTVVQYNRHSGMKR